MKKILSTVAALGLVVGVASTASALEFSATGYYDMVGTYTSQSAGANGSIAKKDASADASDAWIEHEFVIAPKMKVNDKISMNARIFLAGSSPEVGAPAGGTDDGFNHGEDNADGSRGVDFQRLYLDYKSPIGLVRLGRQAGGAYFGDWANRTGGADRLRWFSNDLGGGFKLSGFLQKYADGSSQADSAEHSDDDKDLYSFGGFTKSKDLTYSLWLDYFRFRDTPTAHEDTYRLKGYYKQKFGTMHAMFEFEYWDGEVENNGVKTLEKNSLGFIGEFGMTMDKLDISFMAVYSSGDDDSNAAENDAHMTVMGNKYGIGTDFAPLTVLTNTDTGLLTGETGAVASAEMAKAGVIALIATADMSLSDTLTLHGGIGYAMAEAEMNTFDDEYGWEIDLGVSYKLLDNLTYSADAGYLMAGDFFKGANGAGEEEDVFLFTNGISMTF